MSLSRFVSASVLVGAVSLVASTAQAQTTVINNTPAQPAVAPSPVVAAQPAPVAVSTTANTGGDPYVTGVGGPVMWQSRARFSGVRFAVEGLVGAVIGGAIGFGVSRAFDRDGNDNREVGALVPLLVHAAVTPLAVFGTGRVMGGRGSIGAAYLGEVLVAGASSVLVLESPEAAMWVGFTLAPFGSAVMFEASSDSNARAAIIANARMDQRFYARAEARERQRLMLAPSLAPTYFNNQVVGGSVGLTGRF